MEGTVRGLIVTFLPILVGCATSSSTVGQVQEVQPGIYKTGIGHTVRVGNEKEYEAISLAGQYCHAKGQKLVILPEHSDNDITFTCQSTSKSGQNPQGDGKNAGQN